MLIWIRYCVEHKVEALSRLFSAKFWWAFSGRPLIQRRLNNRHSNIRNHHFNGFAE